jgi:hypothetical protein
VAHRHPVAEHFRYPSERGGKIDCAEDHHLGRRSEGLDEHGDRVFARFTMLAVVAHAGASGSQLASHVAGDDTVEIRVAEGAGQLFARSQNEL